MRAALTTACHDPDEGAGSTRGVVRPKFVPPVALKSADGQAATTKAVVVTEDAEAMTVSWRQRQWFW